MRRVFRRAVLAAAMIASTACSDTGPGPTAPATPDAPTFLTLSVDPETGVWNMEDVEAEYGGRYSLDETVEGTALEPYVDSEAISGETVVCRDHMDSANLYWNSPNNKGVVLFQVPPPLKFLGYTGAFTDRRGIRWRNATFSTSRSADGEDNAGNVWRFIGRFNAHCAYGQRVWGGILQTSIQLVVPDGLIDQPRLIRRGTTDGDGGCGYEYQLVYDPYSPVQGGEDCGSPGSGGGGGGEGEGGGGGSGCHTEYVVIEVSYDDGATWEVWWEGNATVCN